MIRPSASANFYRINQRYFETFQHHIRNVSKYESIQWDDRGPPSDLIEALDFLGLRIIDGGADYSFEGNHFDVTFSSKITIRNPGDSDFFDHLRELDQAMKFLSNHIRSYNDPQTVTADMLAVRAYLDSYRSFLDVERKQPPPDMPRELNDGLLTRLKRVDWFKVSDTAHKWAETIIKLMSSMR